MSKTKKGHNTAKVDEVDMTDDQLKVLGNIIESWNAQAPASPPTWNANNVLAHLALQHLDLVTKDYTPGGRPATFTAPPQP